MQPDEHGENKNKEEKVSSVGKSYEGETPAFPPFNMPLFSNNLERYRMTQKRESRKRI
jgi:hypothetical protein